MTRRKKRTALHDGVGSLSFPGLQELQRMPIDNSASVGILRWVRFRFFNTVLCSCVFFACWPNGPLVCVNVWQGWQRHALKKKQFWSREGGFNWTKKRWGGTYPTGHLRVEPTDSWCSNKIWRAVMSTDHPRIVGNVDERTSNATLSWNIGDLDSSFSERRRTTRELRTCTFEGPGPQSHHQNSTKRPSREEERAIMEAGERKKQSEILGGLAEAGPAESGGAPKSWTHPRKF